MIYHEIKRTIHPHTIEEYINSIRDCRILSDSEQRELFKQFKESKDSEIRNTLFLSNVRFVITIAKQYQNNGLDLEDLIATGNLGLYEAIENYDPEQTSKFTSYAAYWIRKFIIDALDEQHLCIQIPLENLKKIRKVKAFINQFYLKNGYEPSVSEIADELKFTEETVKHVLNLTDYQNTPNSIVEDGDELSLFDSLIGDNPTYDSAFLQDILKKKLKPVEYTIIYTFFFENSQKFYELADSMNLTWRRLVQIKDGILSKLRQVPELKEFYLS